MKKKNFIYVNYQLCKACGFCIEFCPKDVFEADEAGKPVVKRLDDCIQCGLCMYYCPDYAITLDEDQVALSKEVSGDV